MKFQILRGHIRVWVLFIYISCLDPNILLHFGGKSRRRRGLVIFRLVKMLFAKKEIRVLMMGLNVGGKTTILYKLKLGEIITTIPIIGTWFI